MVKKIAFIVGLIFAFAYSFFGICVIVTEYGCSGFVCDIGSYVVAIPWSKLWDFGGSLEYSSKFTLAILNGAGVIINSVIIFFIFFYTIKFIVFGINKLKNV
jgi:hypothetical protein